MNHDETIRHLTYYAERMTKDFGKDHGRIYLRRSIPVGKETYGDDIAAHMGKIIRQKLDAPAKAPH